MDHVLHCNTQYPTPMADVNLRAMLDIRDRFGVQVGYSDHTLGIEVAIAAVALGATSSRSTLRSIAPCPTGPKGEPRAGGTCRNGAAIRHVERALGDGSSVERERAAEPRGGAQSLVQHARFTRRAIQRS